MAVTSSTTPTSSSFWESWSSVPDDFTSAERRLYSFSVLALPATWLIHLFYIFLFAAWGVWPLAIVNVFSVFLWSVAALLLRKQHHAMALAVVIFEVLAHATMVIIFLGWGFGMQYLAIPLFVGIVLISLYPRWVNMTLSVFIMLLFIGWYYYTELFPPLATAPPLQLAVLNIINIAATFFIIAVGVTYLVNEVERAERTNIELLNNVLPSSIAARLKKKEPTIADGFQNASILFADLAGFTPVSQKLTPDELVEMLDAIFSRFDELVEKYGLEKIKTIGDEYMVASGIPIPRDDHAQALAGFALAMRDSLAEYSAANDVDLQMRIGINSGPVVAGVIGKRRFLYDLWGDSVNTASRMESHGIPGEIQITEATRDLLYGQFSFIDRGIIDIKGKGPMQTYLLQPNGHV
jgi:adenylate cyclase